MIWVVFHLSEEFWVGQPKQEVVKTKNIFFSYWAWSSPWGHVLSLKTFRQIPALSWAISYSVFQKVKLLNSLQKLLATFFKILDIWLSRLVIMDDFKPISRTAFFRFGEINQSLFWVLSKIFFFYFSLVFYEISNYKKNISKFFFNFSKKKFLMICLFHRNGKMLSWKWA